jgi:transketolase
MGWDRWVGDAGKTIGMETFGASGPAGALYRHFGFTPEQVAMTAREVVSMVKEA